MVKFSGPPRLRWLLDLVGRGGHASVAAITVHDVPYHGSSVALTVRASRGQPPLVCTISRLMSAAPPRGQPFPAALGKNGVGQTGNGRPASHEGFSDLSSGQLEIEEKRTSDHLEGVSLYDGRIQYGANYLLLELGPRL